jgi:hypothetical protein
MRTTPVSLSATFAAAETVKTLTLIEKVTANTNVFGILNSLVSTLTKSGGDVASATLAILIDGAVVYTVAASGVTGQVQNVVTPSGPSFGITSLGDGPLQVRATLNAAPGAGHTVAWNVVATVAQSSLTPDFGRGSNQHPGSVRTAHLLPATLGVPDMSAR